MLANLPVAACVARSHVTRNPWQAVWVGTRLLPASVTRGLGERTRGPLSVIAAAASGQRELARRRLSDGLRSAPLARARRLLAAAAATGQWTEVDADTADRAPATGGAAAYVAHASGDLTTAEQALAGARGPLDRAHRRWLEGERLVLTGAAVEALEPSRAHPSPTTDAPVRRRRAVVHVVTNSLPEVQAGYTVRTQGIVAAQRRAGIDAHVCTPPGYPVAQGHLLRARESVLGGVPYHRSLPVGRRLDLPDRRLEEYASAVESLAGRVGASVLHAHSKHDNAQAALVAGARLGVPVVYEARGFLEDTWASRGGSTASDFYRWTRATETRCLHLASAVVTLSQTMRADIVARGVDADRVHVVGNCVPDAYLTDPTHGDAVRSRLGVHRDAVVVGTVTTLNDYEGVDVLVEAAGLLDDPRVVVLVVGDGPARDRLASRANELSRKGTRTRVILTGRVPHARSRDHHAAVDVFCLPRRSTPVTRLVPPLKPVEAMALARPVVASDLPPLRELVGTDRGRIVPAGDATALADAIRRLADDPDLRRRLGRAARDHVAAERTWSAAARTYQHLYETVCEDA
ncbi:glycosyltransferase family 4 protein [Intrasporangium sp. YIM S08009]|uniref:glycosyltransferase family 4 protein n=1 Tax=Intrasporangium zincisolvens TaxID=3080018 RepID=UPI002B05EC5B|nr:glycosyltransferase family 4 protein [Intrasporangium sp. YIM S08009]